MQSTGIYKLFFQGKDELNNKISFTYIETSIIPHSEKNRALRLFI